MEPNEDEDDQTASSVSDYNIPVAALMIHAELPYGLKKVHLLRRIVPNADSRLFTYSVNLTDLGRIASDVESAVFASSD